VHEGCLNWRELLRFFEASLLNRVHSDRFTPQILVVASNLRVVTELAHGAKSVTGAVEQQRAAVRGEKVVWAVFPLLGTHTTFHGSRAVRIPAFRI
jgi:hypothetical protein